MKKLWIQFKQYGFLAILVPFISGCNSGGGGSGDVAGTLGSLLGSDTIPTSLVDAEILSFISTTGGSGCSTEAMASMHSPEPATILIMSSGMAAMMYLKKKKVK